MLMLNDLRALETLYWIVRLGTFSAAAEKLGTTQPNVSMRIAELERQMNVRLFDAEYRPARLTQKGRELVDYAEKILKLRSQAWQAMQSTTAIAGKVSIGATETIALTWLPEFVHRVRREYPKIEMELDIDVTENVWSKLNRGTVDLAMLPLPKDARAPVAISKSLGCMPFGWMASRTATVSGNNLPPSMIGRFPILSLGPGSRVYTEVSRWLSDNHVQPTQFVYCNTMSVVAALTKQSLGVSLLPSKSLMLGWSTQDLQQIDVKPEVAPLEFFVVYLRSALSPLLDVLADLACEVSSFVKS